MTIPVKKISTFCKTGSGGTPSRSNNAFFENGTIPWVKSGELKNRYITEVEEYITDLAVEKSSAKLVSKGSLLIAMYGATVGEVSQLTFDATTNQAICNIQPDENVCDVNYLYRFLEASKPYLLSRRVGGGQPNISQGVIKDLVVPLPPLAEQRRIASILDQADELRQKRQQAIEKLDQLLQATFIDMFGDPVSNPKGFEVKKLENLTTKIGSGSTPKGGDSAYKDEGISLVRSLNIYDGQFSYKNLAFIDQDQADKLKNVILQENDVLLNITGASVARCCLIPNEVLPARVNQHVSILRVKDKLIPEFLEALLISKPMKLHLLKISGAGATREALTKLQLQELEIIVPPLDIQNEFLLKLKSIKCLIDLNLKQLNELDKLFISSQNQAFNGTL
ncbi:restriction endonuclease subunit S [Acinetobacter sp. AOR41_HL]|uniref:restriction endonuclease subunit S n=1 Tax=Acinetobacter sp. AOR41_HL TaxID=2919388 RepID=UPI000F71A8CD|nr:restriction endonuclease subunit S [Acinetobacter sp. AOR41_HL]AZM39779.1 restriction endonuclease subunit S [Acinetobacter baumannii]MDA3462469.1 restriction endonuclease subunit S [Acinetobacter sp. AOR41_HL]